MPQFQIDSGLPVYPAGLTDEDAGLVLPVYRAVNSIAQQLSTLTGSVQYSSTELGQLDPFIGLQSSRTNKITATAGENLVYGNIVNLYVDGGIIKARKADALLLQPAHGIVDNPAGMAAGSTGQIVFMSGRGGGMAGTILGATYYLSTGGTVQLSAPTVDGVLTQVVGIGLDAGGIWLNIIPVSRVVIDIEEVVTTAGYIESYFLHTRYADGAYENILLRTVDTTPPPPG